MFARRLLMVAFVATTLAGCTTTGTQPNSPQSTDKVKLIGAELSTAASTAMPTAAGQIVSPPGTLPLATAPVGDLDPLKVLPLVTALNAAWKPYIVNLAKPAGALPWGDVGIQLVRKNEPVGTYCRPEYPFDSGVARGTYCIAPVTHRTGEAHANILLPEAHFSGEVERLEGDKKLAVSLVVAYFYAHHLRKTLHLGDMIEGLWNDESQTQWCLTGVGLRALGVFTVPSPLPTLASAMPEPNVLPLGLAHTFSKVTPKTEHTGWVVDGFTNGTLANCFA